ncbi:MAG: hypothetical protein ABIQ89_03950 [Candidatus Saccharimonadales bacterium]
MSAENPEAMGKLVHFPTANERLMYRNEGTSYSTGQAEVITDTAMRLGLHPEFGDIFRQHLADLNLVVCTYPAFWEGGRQRTEIDVQPIYDKSIDTDVRNQDAIKSWKRILVVGQEDIDDRQRQIARAGTMDEDDRESHADDLSGAAMDWIFAEQATYALGNAVYMQRTIGHYMRDLDGQSPGFLLEHTSSIEYIKKLALPEGTMTAFEDFQRLKAGFGLIRLGETLLKHALFDSHQMAEKVVGRIARSQQACYGAQQIRAHFSSLEPRDAAAYYQSFGDQYDLHDQDD